MKSTQRVLVLSVFVLGICCLFGAAPAEAQIDCFSCDCEDSCSTPCRSGPDIPDCPECNVYTCGSHGPKCASSSECQPTGSCQALSCTTTINGTSAGNTINGTAARECIYGHGGDDTIDGNAGDDQIWGGIGTDTIYGDSGNDCMYGEGDNDHLDGQSGSFDYGDGGAGADTCTNPATETRISC